MIPTHPIAAPATPPGGGIAIIRLSGKEILPSVLTFLHNPNQTPVPTLPPRTLHLCDFMDPDSHTPLDRLLAVFFPAPHSYTGEDMVELHCHGSQIVVSRILYLLSRIGIRPAQPGEFTQRAFLNGKLDLTQAEAVASLIQASSLRAAHQASRQASGSLSRTLEKFKNQMLDLLAQVEAHLDFPEEEIEPWEEKTLQNECETIKEQVQHLLRAAPLGKQLTEGVELVIAGRPNVGKSSLFNRLCGMERAIVTPVPGTTRDILESQIILAGFPIRLLDTAGLHATDCQIEQEGIRRGKEKLHQADRILLILEAHKGLLPEDREILNTLPEEKTLLVWNKADLLTHSPPESGFLVSAVTGEGLDGLLAALSGHLGGFEEKDGIIPLVARQIDCINRLHGCLEDAHTLLLASSGFELVARSLRDALHVLAELTGPATPQQILDRIFENFCIGK